MSSSPKTIFVTGGTGLVGSHVVEEALARGHRVRALVRAHSDTRWLDAWGVEKVLGDLEDPDALRRGVEGADWVFNCAAKVGDWGTLEEFRRLNVDALRLLLDAAAEAQVERFVHVSSLGVYEGRDHFGTDETTPPAVELARRLHPLQDRGRGPGPGLRSATTARGRKSRSISLAVRAASSSGSHPCRRARRLPVVVVRPGFIYGERDRTVLPKLLNALRKAGLRLLRLGRAGAQLHLRQEPRPRRSSSPPRSPRPSARSSTSPTAAGSRSGSSSAGSPSWPA